MRFLTYTSMRSLIICLFCLAVPGVALGQSLTILGSFNPDGGDQSRSRAYGISPNGNYVVGEASTLVGGDQAFVWNSGTGMQGLGFLQTGTSFIHSQGRGVSNDGQVVVGSSIAANGNYAPFRWTSAGGMVAPLGPGVDGSAYSVTASGNLMVGTRLINNPNTVAAEAFHWSGGQGTVYLGYLPNAATQWSRALGASDDGRVIVGESSNAQSPGSFPGEGTEAFRWTEENGMMGLGKLPGQSWSSASDVSADGSVIVGDSGNRSFLWSAVDGLLSLERPAGATFTSARAVSADGNIVVGGTAVNNQSRALMWTRNGGSHYLEDLLTAANVDLGGWDLQEASGISADGMVIVGLARGWIGNDQVNRGFVVDFRTVPEPSSAVLAACMLLPFVFRHRIP